MSLYDYQVATNLERQPDLPPRALIMAAMLKATDGVEDALKAAFPDIWEELSARYRAAGGVIKEAPTEETPAPENLVADADAGVVAWLRAASPDLWDELNAHYKEFGGVIAETATEEPPAPATQFAGPQLNRGTQILYVPAHANGNTAHPDVEAGFVTSIAGDVIFCAYWSRNNPHGELRTRAGGQTPWDSIVIRDTVPFSRVNNALSKMSE